MNQPRSLKRQCNTIDPWTNVQLICRPDHRSGNTPLCGDWRTEFIEFSPVGITDPASWLGNRRSCWNRWSGIPFLLRALDWLCCLLVSWRSRAASRNGMFAADAQSKTPLDVGKKTKKKKAKKQSKKFKRTAKPSTLDSCPNPPYSFPACPHSLPPSFSSPLDTRPCPAIPPLLPALPSPPSQSSSPLPLHLLPLLLRQ